MTAQQPRTVHGMSAWHAEHRPDKTAILFEGREVTYRDLHLNSNRAAHGLRAAGVRTGTRVAYLGKESDHYYEIALACAKAGAVLVPVNWRLTAAEVDHILRDSDASVLFVEEEFRPVAAAALADLPGLRLVALDLPGEPYRAYRSWRDGHPADDLDPGTGSDDAALQIYTSGTTGYPKGVVLAHRSFFTLPEASAAAGVSWIDWLPDDRNLIALPGFGIAGMGWFMHGFVAGGTNVVMRMFVSEEAVRLIESARVTTMFVAPAMLQMMLDEHGVTSATFASLRKVCYGAAPISTALLQRCLEVIGCEFAQIYASTETGTVAVCLPPEDHIPGSPLLAAAGRVCPGTELRVVDDDGPVPAGQIGQVLIRTPAHMLEYWRRPEATAAALDGGWLHMGDAGYLDENGYLFLCDRINDTIIVGGQNIYPAEVERAVGDHPDVAEAAVIGVPDSQWGDAVQACVVLRDGARHTARDLMLFLRGRIADYKIPTRWEFVGTLPRNPTGKILRRELRDRYRNSAPAPLGKEKEMQP